MQVRAEKGHDLPNAGQWFCFDDNSVDPWDIKNLDRDCFGGKFVPDLPDSAAPGLKVSISFDFLSYIDFAIFKHLN